MFEIEVENTVVYTATLPYDDEQNMHCGGRAIASRAMSNGHLWVVCDNCGVLLFQ